MREAQYYNKHEDGKTECELCPHRCLIINNHSGICNVRKNIDGTLYSLNYGHISSIALDPIEKKPLNDYKKGAKILSIGSIGCNLLCQFCQNWHIARAEYHETTPKELDLTPETIVQMAVDAVALGNIGLAYTYNEPSVWYEFMYDTALLIKNAGLDNILVSNGYINEKPLRNLLPYIDAFNIDLKGTDNTFYNRLTKADINPVLQTIKHIAHSGKHLELTYLVIPGKNDNQSDFRNIMEWLVNNAGSDFSLHINRYFPAYRMDIQATAIESLISLAAIAREYIPRVYIGNV
ncbi:MAG: AmmeMemoRadiSam system radical SAM enzyme [Bacteroidales bacterium]